jgi:hypothetical protein
VGVFFDENEPFEHTVRRVWQERRRRPGTIFHQISQIGSVNSRYVPAIQIADLIAWTAHRANSPNPAVGKLFDAGMMEDGLRLCIKMFASVIGYSDLVKTRDELLQRRAGAHNA